MKNSESFVALLTGASGFVGSDVRRALLASGRVQTLYVLGRGFPFRTERVEAGVRVVEVPSDLARERLGLDEAIWRELAAGVDVIYHIAAEVNHLKTAAQLRTVNVDAVRVLMDLTSEGRRKVLNFASTLGAAAALDAAGRYAESLPDDTPFGPTMGYLVSKYEAERVIAAHPARDRANVFRLGYISGDQSTGRCLYADNQLMLLLKSCIQLGEAPALVRTLNFTPVDFTATVMTHPEFMVGSGCVMHLFNQRDLVDWGELISLLNLRGYPVEVLGLPAWQERLKLAGRENALFRFLLVYRRPDADAHVIRFGREIQRYATGTLGAFCARNGLDMPAIKYDYLNKMLDYLVEVDFLEVPHAR